jgi:streptogramin lyase
MQGGTFGAAVDARDNDWLTSYGGNSIAVFDKNDKPLTPPDGITFDSKLGLMQGVIVTPSGDVWVLGLEKSQLVFFTKAISPKPSCSATATPPSPASRSSCRSTWGSTSRTGSG